MDLYGFFHEAVVAPIIDWNRDALKSIWFESHPKEFLPVGRATFELDGEIYSLELRKEPKV